METKLKLDVIYNEDCVVGMKKLPNESVDIIIADPPYQITKKDFGNDSDKMPLKEYIIWCKKWIIECLRVLKKDGTMYIYGFSEILSYIRVLLEPIEGDKLCEVRWIVWHYTNKTVPKLNFWQRSHESILVCYKSKDRVFNRDLIREEYTDGFLNGAAGKSRPKTVGRFSDGTKETVYTAHSGGALPRDIIKGIATLAGASKERVDHPTQKPLKICEKLLKASKKTGENNENVLLVPFCGSGSECVSAKMMGIFYISFELNKDYIKIAEDRLKEIKID